MSEIDIHLTIAAAAAYAREKSGVLTIRTSPRHGCCGGTVELATVDTEPPSEPEAYVETERRGIAVYVHRSLVASGNDTLHVGLDRLLLWKSLYVGGAAAQM